MPKLRLVKQPVLISQLPVDFIETTLVINAWNTVVSNLSAGKLVKLWKILLEQTNNTATAEDIELEITMAHPVTGIMTAYTWSGSLDSGVISFGTVTNALTAGDLTTNLGTTERTVSYQAANNHTISLIVSAVSLIRVRQTSTVDVVSAQIEVNIVWEKLKVV